MENRVEERELIRAFHMMWENYPEAVRLIRRGFQVVAGNRIYLAQGGQVGRRCNVGDPALHKGCQAMNALKSRETRRKQTEVNGVHWDSYWIPVEGTEDYFIHFTNGINETIEKAMKEEKKMSKTLVAYFSASGVTAKVARELAAVEGGSLFEIRPEMPYTTADLDWTNKQSRSTLEMADLNCRPATVGSVEDMAQYNVVFVGFPIWWGREPSVVDTFLEAYDFGGKKLVPFCTSGGSDIGRTAERIQALVGDKACVDAGKRLGGTISEADLKTWTDGLKL